MRRIRLWIIMLLVPVLLLAGCGSDRQQVANAEPTGQTELDVWICYDRNVTGSYYVFLWDTLAEEYGYTIDIKNYSQREIKDKLRMAMACNELPDIFYVPGGSFSEILFDAGACLPVQRYLINANFNESYTQTYKDGNNYIIPCVPRSYAVAYFDKALMERMGLEIPKTLDDLTELVRRVNEYNRENDTHYSAIELGEKDDSMGNLLYCMLAQSRNPEEYRAFAADPSDFSDSVFRQAANDMNQLIAMGAFPDNFLEIGEAEAVRNFINHDAVMMVHQTSLVYHLIQNMGRDNFITAAFPGNDRTIIDEAAGEIDVEKAASDSENGYILMDMNNTYVPGLGVSTRSEHKKEATALCVDFAKRVNRINVEQNGGVNITNERIAHTKTVLSNIKMIHELTDHAEQTDPYLYALIPQDTGDTWGNITKQFLAGELTVDAFLEESGALFASED